MCHAGISEASLLPAAAQVEASFASVLRYVLSKSHGRFSIMAEVPRDHMVRNNRDLASEIKKSCSTMVVVKLEKLLGPDRLSQGPYTGGHAAEFTARVDFQQDPLVVTLRLSATISEEVTWRYVATAVQGAYSRLDGVWAVDHVRFARAMLGGSTGLCSALSIKCCQKTTHQWGVHAVPLPLHVGHAEENSNRMWRSLPQHNQL